MSDKLISKQQIFTSQTPLKLDSGETISPLILAYETYGTLNNDKSNAILICHALSGDAHAAGASVSNPEELGWWDGLIGPNKGIDTNNHYVICINVIGSCKGSVGPQTIREHDNKPYNLDFPVITIADMVKAQKVLIDSLEIVTLKAVIGGSMGGMQAMQWAIDFPNSVKSCVTVAAPSHQSPQALAFGSVGRNAIISDPNWNNGNYSEIPKKGLSIARMIGHITYLSEESLDLKFGRRLQKKEDYGYDFETDFQIESYLIHQGDKFVTRFDANSYLFLSKAMSYFDLNKTYGSLSKAFEKCKSHFLIISISSDWLYPSKELKRIAQTLMKSNKQVTYAEIDSPYGHDGFLIETQKLGELINPFLERL